ncbi:MAG TPA: roadblock/LC7 domain-containing protein [Blastocatellia bacterium]|nr:roadblock/LC7 domain-containing protein [Blastocatellia bacterium]
MDLTQPLKELVAHVANAIGAVLIDGEGEAITYFNVKDPTENERIQLISAYHRIWLSDCQHIAQQLRIGKLEHLIQRYEGGTVMVKALKDNYALVLIGEREMFFGQGMAQLEQIGKIINEDL